MGEILNRLRSWVRASDWALYGVALLAAVLWLVPGADQLGLVAYKFGLVALSAWVGYRIDRGLFPYARPHEYSPGAPGANPDIFRACMLRRAVVVGAVILAVSNAL